MSEPAISNARRSPLAHMQAQLAADAVPGEPGIRLAELTAISYLNLRGHSEPASLREKLGAMFGLDLPERANTFTAAGARRCLWLGPDEWLLAAEGGMGEALADRLASALRGEHVSVIDLSAAYATLELMGPRAREVLAKACSLDFHERAFRAGQCAQSNFARTQAILTLENESPMFRLIVRRSFAAYLAEWLLDAMRD